MAITHRLFNAVTFPCAPCDSAYFTLSMVLFSRSVLDSFTGRPLPWISSIQIINGSHPCISSIDIMHPYHPFRSCIDIIHWHDPPISSNDSIYRYHPSISCIDIIHGYDPWKPMGGTMGSRGGYHGCPIGRIPEPPVPQGTLGPHWTSGLHWTL